jgi:hypothetical protein
MNYRTVAAIILCGALVCAAGCSESGALSTTGNLAMNLAKSDTYLRVWLDDQKATENMAKKAAVGYSEWKVSEPVSTSPNLKFEVKKPEKLGRITMVTLSILQQFQADYSHQADYTVFSKDNDAEAQMKPDVEYALGQPGGKLSVINVEGKTVEGVKLDPGKKYKLVLTVKADKSETAQIEFKTK